jgi:hypothetical protein
MSVGLGWLCHASGAAIPGACRACRWMRRIAPQRLRPKLLRGQKAGPLAPCSHHQARGRGADQRLPCGAGEWGCLSAAAGGALGAWGGCREKCGVAGRSLSRRPSPKRRPASAAVVLLLSPAPSVGLPLHRRPPARGRGGVEGLDAGCSCRGQCRSGVLGVVGWDGAATPCVLLMLGPAEWWVVNLHRRPSRKTDRTGLPLTRTTHHTPTATPHTGATRLASPAGHSTCMPSLRPAAAAARVRGALEARVCFGCVRVCWGGNAPTHPL